MIGNSCSFFPSLEADPFLDLCCAAGGSRDQEQCCWQAWLGEFTMKRHGNTVWCGGRPERRGTQAGETLS